MYKTLICYQQSPYCQMMNLLNNHVEKVFDQKGDQRVKEDKLDSDHLEQKTI